MVLLIVTILFSVAATFYVHRLVGSSLLWYKWLPSYALIVLMTVGTGWAGTSVAAAAAKQGAIGGYHQFLNGTVVAADAQTVPCTRDGACAFEYSCDPYVVIETYYTTDSKGKSTSHTRSVTKYHDCPYATQEFLYTTRDSLGHTEKFGRYVAAKPAPWRVGTAVPSSLPRGIPEPWQKAHAALKAGKGMPMTTESTYDNYILASSDELLKSSSDQIELLQKKRLLPEHTQNLQRPIYDTYDAKKLSFVGFAPENEAEWQDALMQFNSALGSTLRGDLHVVAVKASLLPGSVSPQQYLTALKADWLNGHGKYALAKNAIIVVIGVDADGKNVLWSRASTGMPAGNGALLQSLGTSLTDTPFTVQSVFGTTSANVKTVTAKDGTKSEKVVYDVGSGLIPQKIMVEFPFKRVCMACSDEDETSDIGYVNIPIPTRIAVWGYVLTSFLVLLISAGYWFVFVHVANTVWRTVPDASRQADYYSRSKRFTNFY